MTSAERRRAVRDLERCLARMVAKGWVMRALTTHDHHSEDFTVEIQLTHPGYDVERKGVM